MPIWTPLAPSTNAAAIPRPSAMPPAAITGTSTASTTCGTSAIVPTWLSTVGAQEHAPVAARLGALGDDRVAAVIRQPLGLGHRRRRGDHPGPARPHPVEEIVRRQPEVEADDLRTELLDDLAAGVVERDDRHVVRDGVGETELGVVRRQHARATPPRPSPSTGWSS